MKGLQWLGSMLARFLEKPTADAHVHLPTDPIRLAKALKTGDVLLVEGKRRISAAIKYLTHSNWSHAALYVGGGLGCNAAGEPLLFVEADTVEGVRGVTLSQYAGHHVRICRPSALTEEDCRRVMAYAAGCIGHRYDLRNVLDLARYLIPLPVPARWRRRMLAFGSGDPTRAICSTLIALAFQSVRYPILPTIEKMPSGDPDCMGCLREQWHIRHHSLFVPADFDVSPFFAVVKPEFEDSFDYCAAPWAEAAAPENKEEIPACP
jgi:hypothetical protein